MSPRPRETPAQRRGDVPAERLVGLLELIDVRLVEIGAELGLNWLLVPPLKEPLKLKENTELGECDDNAREFTNNLDSACVRVGVVTKDPPDSGKVEVSYTDADGTEKKVEIAKAGRQTKCLGPLPKGSKVTIHGKDCEAIITVVNCKCP